MPTKKMVYQFKITLKDTKPPIWRRIQVPSTYTFWDLHVAIQDAMDWQDYHLHEFRVQSKTGETLMLGIPSDEDFGMYEESVLPCWEHKISTYAEKIPSSFVYIYDFGDDWLHKIDLEKILPAEPGVTYPQCIKGKRASPPEDCGGPWGYLYLLEKLADPNHEEYEEMKEWVESQKGEPFDPEEFDPKEVFFDDPKTRFNNNFNL